MVNSVDISRWWWPLSLFDGWRRVPLYGKSRGTVIGAAERYLESLVEEVAEATGRSIEWGRFLFWSGHVLGWAGLLLSLFGLLTLGQAHIERLLWGPFGIGLLMQLPSGALVRAGRRELMPSAAELAAVDRRAPVLVLRSFRGDLRLDGLKPALRDALAHVGPVALATDDDEAARFGEVDRERAAVRAIDQARLLVIMPQDGMPLESEFDAIAKRRHAHKLIVLIPPAPPGRSQSEATAILWPALRSSLARVPGFERLPADPPERLMAVHLTSTGEATLVTGASQPSGAAAARALLFSLYGMKVHGRW